MSHFIRGASAPQTGNASHLMATAPSQECCGCPSENRCRTYCVVNYGARGGYCEGFLDLRCVCIY